MRKMAFICAINRGLLVMLCLLASLLSIGSCSEPEKEHATENEIEPINEDGLAAISSMEDTASGYFTDFDFQSLRGIAPLDSTNFKSPFVEVRFRGDSVLVTKWFGLAYPRVFPIRIIGNRGLWLELEHEPHIKNDVWLKAYVALKDYLVLFKFFSDTNGAKGWEQHTVEVVYPGPIVYSARIRRPETCRIPKLKFPHENELSYIHKTTYRFVNDSVFALYESIPEDETHYLRGHKLESHATQPFRSILWIYFDLARITH